jgi:hypothetical protein
MGLPSHHSTNNISIIHNIKATTDSAAGSHLPSFIQLYWAPQQTRLRRWDGEGIARQRDKRVAVGGPKRAHCTAIFCWIHWSRSAGCAWHWSERWPIDPGTEPLPHSMQADMITLL